MKRYQVLFLQSILLRDASWKDSRKHSLIARHRGHGTLKRGGSGSRFQQWKEELHMRALPSSFRIYMNHAIMQFQQRATDLLTRANREKNQLKFAVSRKKQESKHTTKPIPRPEHMKENEKHRSFTHNYTHTQKKHDSPPCRFVISGEPCSNAVNNFRRTLL